MDPVTLLIVLALLATALSLIAGVSTMAVGHPVAHRSSEQWMMLRIGFQALAVLLLLLTLYFR